MFRSCRGGYVQVVAAAAAISLVSLDFCSTCLVFGFKTTTTTRTSTTTTRRQLLSSRQAAEHNLFLPIQSEVSGPCWAHKNENLETVTITKQHRGRRVGIIGAGAIAFGTAALLSLSTTTATGQYVDDDDEEDDEAYPMIWSPSGAGTAQLLQQTQLETKPNRALLTATGAIPEAPRQQQVVLVVRIAHSCLELMQQNDVIILALPANGHWQVMNDMVPHLDPDRHHVIISSHASLGALYLAQAYQEFRNQQQAPTENQDMASYIPITAWGTTVCTARRNKDGISVHINTIRQSVDLCTIPSHDQDKGLILCQKLFPMTSRFQLRQGLLAVSLSNLNPQNHLGIALGNLSRMEKGETWYQLYHVTPKIGRLLEQLDQERLSICQALGPTIQTKTIFEHFAQGFLVPIMDTISEMNQETYRQGKDVYGPTTADSRYVTEDVPYGLTLTIVLGDLVGRPATLHRAGLQLMSAMYGVDFMQENKLLQALKLSHYTLEVLQEAAYTGILVHKQQTNKIKDTPMEEIATTGSITDDDLATATHTITATTTRQSA